MVKQNTVVEGSAENLNAITADELTANIVELYMAGSRDSTLALGGVGVGKSESVKEAAKIIAQNLKCTYYEWSADAELPEKPFVFVDLRLTEIEPTDIGGIPRDSPNGKTMVYKPLEYVKLLSEHPGILFLDEITNETRPNMKAASYKILNELRMGTYRLNKGAVVVAAGNKPDEAVGLAEGLPFPMASRLTIFQMRVPTLEEWVAYMDSKYTVIGDKGEKIRDWDKRSMGFLARYEGQMYQLPKESMTLENFPTPRSWTKVSSISHKINEKLLSKYAEGRLGMETGRMYMEFLNTHVEPLEVYVNDHAKWKALGSEMAAKYLLSVEIADKWSKNTKIDDLCHYMLQEDKETLAVVFTMLRNDEKNEIVKRMLRKDKYIIDFLKKLSSYKYNTET